MDTLNFDGACDRNPGGRMGFGWVIDLNGQSINGNAEQKSQPGNTNNVAEYTALKKGLEHYIQQDGKGPLLIKGDSKLVINQMAGKWKISNTVLQGLATQIGEFINGHNLKVKYEWVPRDKNSVADNLAAPKPSSKPLLANQYVADVCQAPITEKLQEQIIRINRDPSPGFKTMMGLKVGGLDIFSKKTLSELVTEAGAEVSAIAKKQFVDNETAQASVLRWVLRGLAVDHAVHKVKVDLKINANTKS
ncbi:MAG: ribonuclease HI family protein [Methanosarcinaceae archaeon]|nr:ribonuclease HI family protein [Methanosarcinaceae archaeon]